MLMACVWCVDMSRAKPASTDDSLGVELPLEPELPINHPTVPAIANRATASTATSTTRERRGGTVSGSSSVVIGGSRSVVVIRQPVAGANSGCPNVLGCCLNVGWEQSAPYSGVVFGLYRSVSMNCWTRGSDALSTNS